MANWVSVGVWILIFLVAAAVVGVTGASAGDAASIGGFAAAVVSSLLQAAVGGRSASTRLRTWLVRVALLALAVVAGALLMSSAAASRPVLPIQPITWLVTTLLVARLMWLHWAAAQYRKQFEIFNRLRERLQELLDSWPGGAEDSKFEAVVLICLRCLRDTLYEGLVHSTLRPLQRVKPRVGVITLFYLVPGEKPGDPLSVEYSFYSAHTPFSAIEGPLTWISEHYRPAAFDEEAFETLMSLSASERDPRQHFLSHAGSVRGQVVSAVGFVSRTRESVRARFSRQNLYFDPQLPSRLKAAGFAREERLWAEVRSFIAVPVPFQGDGDVPVLFAVSTSPCGFTRQDEDWMKNVGFLLSRMGPQDSQQPPTKPPTKTQPPANEDGGRCKSRSVA